jgi:hypothetical protein
VNYWLALIYDGVALGIWPGAALAFLVTHLVFSSDRVALFIVTFIGFTAIMAVLVMISLHFLVWRRRARSQAAAQKARGSKLTVLR